MQFALYDPQQGYYRKGRTVFGPAGDFFTSPYTHPIFAQVLGDFFHSLFLRLHQPDPFHLVELGAGEGRLAGDLLPYLQREYPRLWEQLVYCPLEIDQGELPERITGVVFSNEFFDALPVHRVRVSGGRLREIYVREDPEGFREVEGELSDDRILEYMGTAFPELKEGYEYEVNLALTEVLEELDRHLERGFLLTIDYGFDRDEYGRLERAAGTLLCYYRHQLVTDPYQRVGEQDMTAHVHFEVLREWGRRLGWINFPLQTQREFLMTQGLAGKLQAEERRGLQHASRLEERLGLKRLLEPGGVSDTMKVLLQEVPSHPRNRPAQPDKGL